MAEVKRKKILFLVTQSEMGGAQRYIYEVSKALAERYEILVAAGEPADGGLFQKLKNTQVSPMYLKQMRRAPWPWQVILAIKEIFDLLKKEKPDVLFLCSTTAGVLGSIAARIYRGLTSAKIRTEVRPRVIYRIGGWAFRDPRPFWKNWLIFWTEKLTARFKDLIIVNSEYDLRIAVEKKIVSPEKIIKIYNGIDLDSLDFLSKEGARKHLECLTFHVKHSVLIGCVANFYKTKGLEYLIEAIYRLSQLNCDYRDNRSSTAIITAIIIGEGRERPRIEALIKKYRMEGKIILAGRIPDAYKYLKAFDILVLPSLKEGFPWIILEAIAAGVPIVATKVGAVPEIIPEEFLVEPGNAEALAQKISWTLEHLAFPKLKQEFSLQRMVEETEKLL